MNQGRQQRIIVGVSGSPASQAALRWAAGEARLRGAVLHVLHVSDPVRPHAPYAAPRDRPAPEQQRQAQASLDTVVRGVFGAAVPGWVTLLLAEGSPARVLVQCSAEADLLVLGSTTSGGQAEPPAGPVVRACLAHARCPLVIISSSVPPDPVPRPGRAAVAGGEAEARTGELRGCEAREPRAQYLGELA
jgi:nucleotide-binding universal stress UspA family protein